MPAAGFRIDVLDTRSSLLVESCVTLIENAFGDPARYNPSRLRAELDISDPTFYRHFFVAMEAGEVIGIGGVKAADWASDTHLLYLSAVKQERRGRGVGRALLTQRLEWLEQNFSSGRILVSTSKTKRYREAGFVEIRNSRLAGRHLMMRRFG